MSDSLLTRRSLIGAAALLGLGGSRAFAQALPASAATPKSLRLSFRAALSFPADHGPHPDYRIEWWYLTANLTDASGNAYGAQWTLFRQAMAAGAQGDGWATPQIWMGHAAVTSATAHHAAESLPAAASVRPA